MNYRPLGSKIVIKVLEKSTIKVAGMTLSVAKKSGQKEWDVETLSAEIVRCGPEVSSVQEGETVIVPGTAGRWIDADIANSDATHRIIDEDEILAVDETVREGIHAN